MQSWIERIIKHNRSVEGKVLQSKQATKANSMENEKTCVNTIIRCDS